MLQEPNSEFAPYNELACHKKHSIYLDDGRVNKANKQSQFRNKLRSLSLAVLFQHV